MAKKKAKKPKLEKPPKSEVLRPKVKKKEKKKAAVPRTKRSIIVHKKEEKVENLYQLLGELEKTIGELSGIYATLPPSRHYNVGGRMKSTLKQETIAKQIEQAQRRADRLLGLIEKEQRGY